MLQTLQFDNLQDKDNANQVPNHPDLSENSRQGATYQLAKIQQKLDKPSNTPHKHIAAQRIFTIETYIKRTEQTESAYS